MKKKVAAKYIDVSKKMKKKQQNDHYTKLYNTTKNCYENDGNDA